MSRSSEYELLLSEKIEQVKEFLSPTRRNRGRIRRNAQMLEQYPNPLMTIQILTYHFKEHVYRDLLYETPSRIVEFFTRYPQYILSLDSPVDESSLLIRALLLVGMEPTIFYELANILTQYAQSIGRDVQECLRILFESKSQLWYTEPLVNHSYTPIQCWATNRNKRRDNYDFDCFSALLNLAPSGVEILSARDYPRLSELITEIYEYGPRSVPYSAERVRKPSLIRLDTKLDILVANQEQTLNRVFTTNTVRNILGDLPEYRAELLVAWIRMYPPFLTKLLEVAETDEQRAEVEYLREYLFHWETGEITQIHESMKRDDDDEFYKPLPTTILSIIDKEGQRLEAIDIARNRVHSEGGE